MNFSKRLPVFFLILFSVFYSVQAFPFEVFVSPFVSVRNERAEEALFFSGTFGSDKSKMCSLLEWKSEPILVFGTGVVLNHSLGKAGSFMIESEISFAAAAGGKMTDSDWNGEGIKFNYSRFKSSLRRSGLADMLDNLDFSASAAYEYDVMELFSVKPFCGLAFSSRSLEAVDGHGWYGSASWTSDGRPHSWDSPYAHYFPDGKYHLAGIRYRTRTVSVFLGMELSKTFSEHIKVSCSAGICPYAFVLAQDRHLGSKDYYTTDDYIHSFWGRTEFSAGLSFILHPRCTLDLSFSYARQAFARGKQYYSWDDGSRNSLSGQDGGYAFSSAEFRTGVKFRLF